MKLYRRWAQPEWGGFVTTGLKALSNQERLALWIIKRGPKPMWFNFWGRSWWK